MKFNRTELAVQERIQIRFYMRTIRDIKNSIPDDQEWNSIAEFSLCEAICQRGKAAELMAATFFHTIRELGFPAENLKRIEGTIADTASGARRPFDPEFPAVPVRICLFCSRKTLECLHHSDDLIHGAWGYFVIERRRDILDTSCTEHYRVIELYIYKEGY